MKTKKFFFIVSLLILGGISKGSAQVDNDTTVFRNALPDTSTLGLGNVLLGAGAGQLFQSTTKLQAQDNAVNSQNVFVGIFAGRHSDATGIGGENSRNTFLGYAAGLNNTSGSDNVFIGRYAGFANTTGTKNVMIKTFRQFLTGQAELRATGSHNTMVGFETGDFLTSGDQNCFFGSGSGQFTTEGLNNTFLGRSSGNNNVLGSNNISIGSVGPAGSAATTQFNILIGLNSGQICSGNNNVIIGRSSGATLTTGINNSFLGRVNSVAPGLNNTVILATGADWDSNRLYIDESGRAGFNLGITGANISNTPQNRLEIVSAPGTSGLVAGTAGLRFRGFTNANFSTLTATATPKVLSVNGNGDVILVDDATGSGSTSSDNDWHLTGNSGTSPSFLSGWEFGSAATIATSNFIGTTASSGADLVFRRGGLKSGVLGTENTSFGYASLAALTNQTSARYNTAVGSNAGVFMQGGSNNTIVGDHALSQCSSANWNIAIGKYAGSTPLTTSSNPDSPKIPAQTLSGNGNIFIGNYSGFNLTSGQNNIFLGPVAVPLSPATPTVCGTDTSSSIVFSTNDSGGVSRQRLYIHNNGFTGIGLDNNAIPQNMLEIKRGTVNGVSGLRLTSLTSNFNAPTNTTNKFLTVNGVGDVVLETLPSSTGSACNLYSCDGTIVTTPTNSGNNPTPGLRTVTMGDNNLFFDTHLSNFTDGTAGKGRIYIGNTMDTASFPNLVSTPLGSESQYRLLVEGGILTEKVKVALRNTGNWMDGVFANDYKLMPLKEVEAFVKGNKHLPGIESAEDLVKNGLDLANMQAKQMGKIEELTLHVIEQSKEIEELKAQVKLLLEKSK